MPELHVPKKHMKEIKWILKTYLPNATVLAHGSRVTGDCHAGSDLDLAAKGATAKEVGKCKTAFQDSNVPFIVDLWRWENLPDYTKEHITNLNYAILHAKGTQNAQ